MDQLYDVMGPVFNSAKSTLAFLRAVGNKDAAAFEQVLGFEMDPPLQGRGGWEKSALLSRICAVTVELRYALVNRAIEQSGSRSVLDLGCGYTPRCGYLTGKGCRYVGGDEPQVAEDMTRVSQALLNGKALFQAVDVTSAGSVKAAADRLPGPIAICCEGLTERLDKDGLTAMAGGFAALLAARDGCWVSTDFEGESYFLAVALAIAGDSHEELNAIMDAQVDRMTAAGRSPVFANSEEKLAFLGEMGLQVERRPVREMLSGLELLSLGDLPEAKRQAFAQALDKLSVWVMTARKPQAEKPAGLPANGLKIEQSRSGEALILHVSGRLDSLSAPDLLYAFKTIPAWDTVRDMTLDLAGLEYASSAGLRVFLMMYRGVGQGHFHLVNVNDAVKNVLHTCGFSQCLGL